MVQIETDKIHHKLETNENDSNTNCNFDYLETLVGLLVRGRGEAQSSNLWSISSKQKKQKQKKFCFTEILKQGISCST